MKMKVSVLLNVLLATVLLSSMLFSAITAKTGSSSEYDPWIDTDDDGDIDFDDIVAMAMIYGTSGTPINKTALLLDLQERVENLEDKVEALESQTGLPPPDYDSGWVSIDLGTTRFTHNLGTTDVLVYVVGFKPITPETGGVHQTYYGGYESGGYRYGCYWHRLTDTTIDIYRIYPDDPYWTQVRVMMWKIREPAT